MSKEAFITAHEELIDELLDALQRATKWLRLVVATEDDPRCEDDLEAAEIALAHARGERT